VLLGWTSVQAADSSLQPGHYFTLMAPHLPHTANQEQPDQRGKHNSHELLMMGIVMLETCWAYKKYNKYQVASSWFFDSSVSHKWQI